MWVRLTTYYGHESVSIPWTRIRRIRSCKNGALLYLDGEEGTFHVRETMAEVEEKTKTTRFYDLQEQEEGRCT
jgi:hypothetical protein